MNKPKAEPLFSSFETWPDAVFYAPVFIYWFYLAMRYRGLTLPTIANVPPALSGFLGESKSDIMDLLGAKGRAHSALYGVMTTAATPDAEVDLAKAKSAMQSSGLHYPVVAKPDVGQNGTGVRIVRDDAGFADYLATFPRGAKLIVQKYIEEEGEAGVFYIRYPHEERGHVVSLTLKYFPYVIGDGSKTLRELILADARAQKIALLYFQRHGAALDTVVPAGKRVRLVSVGNHCKGAIFKNGVAHITPRMADAFDAIAKEIPGFYFGRFDVRFKDLEDLKNGKDFTILEVNGADSEMTHIWDAKETLRGAYSTLAYQYRTAFAIGAENRVRGTRAVNAFALIRAWQRDRALFASYTREE